VYDYRARWYLPEAGVFGERDPVLGNGRQESPFVVSSRGQESTKDWRHAQYFVHNIDRFTNVGSDGGRGNRSGQSWNRYIYVGANWVNVVDPSGLETVIIFKTERNPKRDPVDPWAKAASFLAARYERQFQGKYRILDVLVVMVNRVSQVKNYLSSLQKIVKVAFVGHATAKRIAVGSESKPDTNISSEGGPNDVDPKTLDWSNLKPEASIDIMGCHAGAGEDSIAQDIANASGVPVIAPDSYLNFDDSSGRPFIHWYYFGHFKKFEPASYSPVRH
jgi:hypothetical protein